MVSDWYILAYGVWLFLTAFLFMLEYIPELEYGWKGRSVQIFVANMVLFFPGFFLMLYGAARFTNE
jgi:hypothetical protein